MSKDVTKKIPAKPKVKKPVKKQSIVKSASNQEFETKDHQTVSNASKVLTIIAILVGVLCALLAVDVTLRLWEIDESNDLKSEMFNMKEKTFSELKENTNAMLNMKNEIFSELKENTNAMLNMKEEFINGNENVSESLMMYKKEINSISKTLDKLQDDYSEVSELIKDIKKQLDKDEN